VISDRFTANLLLIVAGKYFENFVENTQFDDRALMVRVRYS